MADTIPEIEAGLPVMSMADDVAFADWLAAHPDAPGVWLGFPKKGAAWSGIDKHQALDVALRHGWIDGQAARDDHDSFLMWFTPPRPCKAGRPESTTRHAPTRWSRQDRATRAHHGQVHARSISTTAGESAFRRPVRQRASLP